MSVLLRAAQRYRSAAAPPPPPPPGGGTGTLVGWSSSADHQIPSVTQEIIGTWMARQSWDNIQNADWLSSTEYPAYVASHPTGAADIGVPLIPHDSGTAFDTLFDQVISGSKDSVFYALGQKLATDGPPTIYARVFWEFNMSSAQMTSAKFVSAWRRAIPQLRTGFSAAADAGQQIKIVWCYLGANADPTPFWPGGDYVDVLGADVYGIVWAQTNPTVSQMLGNVNSMLSQLNNYAAAYGKPVSLGEWANVIPKSGSAWDTRGCGDCPEYIDLIFDWAEFNTEYLCYYNIDAGGVGQFINNMPNSLARFQARAAALQSS